MLYPIFYLMLALGLRRGEVLGLRWEDVDFSEETVRIRQALTMPGDGDTPIIKGTRRPNRAGHSTSAAMCSRCSVFGRSAKRQTGST